jgi:hypothetical protein
MQPVQRCVIDGGFFAVEKDKFDAARDGRVGRE